MLIPEASRQPLILLPIFSQKGRKVFAMLYKDLFSKINIACYFKRKFLVAQKINSYIFLIPQGKQ